MNLQYTRKRWATILYFTTISFLFYFLPAVILIYFMLGHFKHRKISHIFLLVSGVIFYLWIEPLFLPVMMGMIVANYVIGLKMKKHQAEENAVIKLMKISYIVNIGLLVLVIVLYFILPHTSFAIQYYISSFLVLPISLTFAAMRGISYHADIRDARIEADHNLVIVGLYMSFFPQSIVGPMVTYQSFKEQLLASEFKADLFFHGICRFVTGLGKLILLAGNLAVVADEVFYLSKISDSQELVPVTLMLLGIMAFFFQIYYSFSGYTDIAVSLGNLFGFTAPENFNYPYLADSVTDFWNRWMITVRAWFEQHILRPLNRKYGKNEDQMVITLLVTILSMGLWYTLGSGVLLWALIITVCIVVEKMIIYERLGIPKVVKHIYVLFMLMISWVPIRAENIYEAFLFYKNLYGMNQNGFLSSVALVYLKEYWFVFVAALIFIFPVAPLVNRKVEEGSKLVKKAATVIYPILLLIVTYLCTVYLARGLYEPVSYFRF